MPFVLIQIIMVGLIIAFPAIVSSGLDKEVAVDLDKIGAEMQANMPKDDSQPAPEPAPGASAPAGGEAPAGAEEDPMKAMQEQLDRDAGKK